VYLQAHGRVSTRALQREYGLDVEALEELVAELVDVQRVARRDGDAVAWAAGPADPSGFDERAAAGAATADLRATAERRQLTVMFCDLVASTALGARLDAEDLREVVTQYYEAATRAVERYEGHVANYLGDGLLIYFGYPRAHEDDAERAIRAGLDILAELARRNAALEAGAGVPLVARIGTHTGPVVVGDVGRRLENVALGETMNLAARIEEAAVPDTLVVSAETLRLVRGVFVTEDLGPRTLRGIAEPVHVHRVVQPSGVRSRLDLARDRLTAFVGRDQEIALLLDRWEQVLEGDGQTVCIRGEAGVGKSRLVLTLRERLGDQPHTWLECRSSPYTRQSALHPVVGLFEEALGLRAEQSQETRWRRLEAAAAIVGLVGAPDLPLVGDVLGLARRPGDPDPPASPEVRRHRTLEVLITWMLGLASEQPALLLVEDVHWCDPTTIELIRRLVEQLPRARLLLLTTTREEFVAPWMQAKGVTSIALGRLRRRQAAELVARASPAGRLPDDAVDEIVRRADGIPLYLEELTRAVLESGALTPRDGGFELDRPLRDVAIPATLQDSLTARLDRLSAAKEVAQVAATLGREFPYRLLEAVSGLDGSVLRHALGRLVEADLLIARGTPPAATYTFKHALLQESAYQSLLRARRREIHARVAHALEELFPARAAAEPEVVGRHWEEAGDLAAALRCFEQAGTAALASASGEAVAHLRHCLELLPRLPATRERDERELALLLALGSAIQAVRGYSDDDLEPVYDRARTLAHALSARSELPFVLFGLALWRIVRWEQLDEAESFAREAVALGQEVARLGGYNPLAMLYHMQGRFTACREAADQGIAAYRADRHRPLVFRFGSDLGAGTMLWQAHTLWMLGFPDRARERAEEARVLAETTGHPFTLAFAHGFGAVVHFLRSEPARTRELAERSVAISREYGFPAWHAMGLILRGWARAIEHDEDALEEVLEGASIAATTRNQAFVPMILSIVGYAQYRCRRYEDGARTIEGALAFSRERVQPFWDAELLRIHAKTERFLRGDRDGAEAVLRRAMALARQQSARSLELRAAISLARMWRDEGRDADARALLAPLLAWFTEGFETRDLREASAIVGVSGR